MKSPLEIELTVNRHPHQAGSPIDGNLLVTTHESLHCHQLAIALQNSSCLLDGQGEVVLEQDFQQTLIIDPRDRKAWISGIDPIALFDGPWKAGTQYNYPFQLTAPSAAGYQGTHFQHGWLLHAHAMVQVEGEAQVHATAIHPLDITRGPHTLLEREIPPPDDTQQLLKDAHDPRAGFTETILAHGSSFLFLTLFGVIPLVSGGLAVVLAILDSTGIFTFPFFEGHSDTLSVVFSGLAAFGFGCYMLPLMLDSMRGDDLQLYIAPRPLAPGDELQFVAMVRRSLADSISSIEARVICRENAAGPGTEETSEILFQQQLSIPANVAVAEGPWLMLTGEFHLPHDLPASIEADFGDVEYTIYCECKGHNEQESLVAIEETVLVV